MKWPGVTGPFEFGEIALRPPLVAIKKGSLPSLHPHPPRSFDEAWIAEIPHLVE
jgi:hypothetical protein